MKFALTTSALATCTVVACSGDTAPPAFSHLHQDAFVVAHFDMAALRDSSAFQRFVAQEPIREGWAEMQSSFAKEMGFEMGELSELTFSGIEAVGGRPGVLILLRGGDAADAAKLSRPQQIVRGEYNTGELRASVDEDGEYWLEVDSYTASYDRRPFTGDLRGEGALAEAFAAALVDPNTGYVGPVKANAGATLELAADWEHPSTLSLMRTATPTRVGEHDAYPNHYDGFMAHLGDGLVAMGDELVYYRDRDEEGAWDKAVADALELGEQTGGLFDALHGMPSGRTLVAASAWSALPAEVRQEMVQELGRVLSKREALALNDIETVALEAQLDDGFAVRAYVLCEDEEGTEEVRDLVEDLIDLAEAFRGLPREVERILESIRVEQKGLEVRLELDIDAEGIDELIRTAFPEPSKSLKASRVAVAKASIMQIHSAATQYFINNQRYPETLEELVIPDSAGAKYLAQEKVPRDPWGHEYILEADGDEILIWTYGADSQVGGEGESRDFNNRMIINEAVPARER